LFCGSVRTIYSRQLSRRPKLLNHVGNTAAEWVAQAAGQAVGDAVRQEAVGYCVGSAISPQVTAFTKTADSTSLCCTS